MKNSKKRPAFAGLSVNKTEHSNVARPATGRRAHLSYRKLERRQVLSATYGFNAGLLTLAGFDAGQNLTFQKRKIDFGGGSEDAFIFEIESGSWGTSDGPVDGIQLNGMTTLEVRASLLTGGLSISGENNISLMQSGDFSIAAFSISDFSLSDQSIELDIDGDVNLENIVVTDTLPADAFAPVISVEATGSIEVMGTLSNMGLDEDGTISLSATGLNSDVSLRGAIISSLTGDVTIAAADEVNLLSEMGTTSSIDVGMLADVQIMANTDDADGDSTDGIMMSDGSAITADDGDISLIVSGNDGGGAVIGSLTTDGAVTVNVTGDIVDGTADEMANISGMRTDLTGSTIGAADDIDIEIENLSFNSTGAVQVTDLSGGLTVDMMSSAGSGTLIANSPLLINADIALIGSFDFVAGDSPSMGDNITISATVSLMADSDALVRFTAGDDIIFDGGQVITAGLGEHSVELNADNDGGADLDRGSVTNTLSATTSVITNNLTINAADGIGDVSAGFRTEVDSLFAENTFAGDILIEEQTSVVLVGIINVDRDIFVLSNGSLQIDEAINAGTGDVRLVANGDITQMANGMITANELGVQQVSNALIAANDLDGNNFYDIHLCFDNAVDVFAATNAFAGGDVDFNNTRRLLIDEVSMLTVGSVAFATTTGVTTNNGDSFIATDGSLRIEEAINVGAGTVRLVASGDVSQNVDGEIVANRLGVRQIGTVFDAAENTDALNTTYDIILDNANNDVNFLAAFNAFDGGVFVFNDFDDLTIDSVALQMSGNKDFALTQGITTTSTAAAVAGGGDGVVGDVLINADGFLQINQQILAGDDGIAGLNGNADVRLTVDGDVDQLAAGVIVANELGVVQASNALVAANDPDSNGFYDVHLCFDNLVDVFAASNAFAGGDIDFNNTQRLVIDAVSTQTISNVSFATTTGITTNNGDSFIATDGSLRIEEAINVGAGTVRLVASGDVSQNVDGEIVANRLGVRQIGTVFDAAENTDALNTTYDIILDNANNDVNFLAAFNAFDGGVFVFNDFDDLTIDSVALQMSGNKDFALTQGITTTSTAAAVAGGGDGVVGDVLINADGFLQINQQILAGDDGIAGLNGNADVRLTVDGDVDQLAAGVIVANELGVVQASNALVAANDLDSNGFYDIHLCFDNLVDVFAASNAFAGGDVDFNNAQRLLIDAVSTQTISNVSFATTTGITTNNGDSFIATDGSLRIEEAINVGTGTVRLVASGDVSQTANGVITADRLGVRQIGTVFDAAENTDALNTTYDIILDNANNDVNFLAAFNAFDGGVFVFNDFDDLTIDMVSMQTSGNKVFALTEGITTTSTAAAVAGAGDGVGGDVLINADGFLQINHQILAGDDGIAGLNGNADVRLTADGDVDQLAAGVIVANELGVVQASNALVAANDLDSNGFYDIHLCFDNLVDVFAASNAFAGGDVDFNNAQRLLIDAVPTQTISNVSFATTTGITTNNGDSFIAADGSLRIEEAINVGTGTVRLVASGDVSQTANGVITADRLGARQIGTVFDAADNTDALNTTYDIILDNANNDVNFLAAFNAFDGGVFVFNDFDDLTIDMVSMQMSGNKVFALTEGITTTSTAAAVAGAGDGVGGDVLINADGFLQINHQILAGDDGIAGLNGNADVRLTADGDVTQAIAGVIVANELGVVQASNALVAANDLDNNGFYDIHLCFDNLVDVFAASNAFAGGDVDFNNAQGLALDTVQAQMIGNVAFATTTGVTTNGGDLFLQSGGMLRIDEAINVGANTVRLVASGDISQGANGEIIADRLGVRQIGTAFDAAENTDALITTYDIILDNANNDVNFLAAFNAFDGGVFVFNDFDDLTVDMVSMQMSGNKVFALTEGITTTSTAGAGDGVGGDVLINADGFLQINHQILAGDDGIAGLNGNADVRLTADGDVTQAIAGVIVANELGVVQASNALVAANDLDNNGFYDIHLCFDNLVDVFAASNAFAGGDIDFNNAQGLTLDAVSGQMIGNVAFATTTGVTTSGGDLLLQTGGMLRIDEAINVGANTVRLVASGDVSQGANGEIVADRLGVRQIGTVFNATDNTDALNTTYDIILDNANNDVNFLAAFNAFDGGVFVFNDFDDLTIDMVSMQMSGNKVFALTEGITTTSTAAAVAGAGDGVGGDVLINADGFLQINHQILAGDDGIAGLNGNADVRLTADGDVTQAIAGVIVANELGVVQASNALVAADDLNNNGFYDIHLCFDNRVDTLAANNVFDGGTIAFNDADDLTIDAVLDAPIGGVSFSATPGLTTASTLGPIAGSEGDILIQAGGFLQINQQILAGDDGIAGLNGNADVFLIGNGDIIQSSTGAIIANELGVRQEASVFSMAGDIDGNMQFDILLGATFDGGGGADEINDVDQLAMINRDVNGDLQFSDTESVRVDEIALQSICSLAFAATNGVTSDDGTTAAPNDGMGNISIAADVTLNDGNNIDIITGGDAEFRGGVEIELANDLGDRLWIGGNAMFVDSPDIEVGQDGAAAGTGIMAGTANVLFGSLTVNAGTPIVMTTADITEDDGTEFSGTNQIETLILTSAGDITNQINTSMQFGQLQLNAVGNNILLGNQTNDLLQVIGGTELLLGVNAENASLQIDSSVEINGSAPIVNNDDHATIVGDPFVLGTEISDTLFVTSTGHIEQTVGSLNAVNLGLSAANHIHLESISTNNVLFAASAGDATADIPLSHQMILDDLAAIDDSEVDASLQQSVSIFHAGVLTVGLVGDPLAGGMDLVGITTTATDDGSILIIADDSIAINEDVVALSTASRPQVTVYVDSGLADDATQIIFAADAEIRVESPTNVGVVNNAQTTAFFGVDSDGNGTIDQFFVDANGNGVFDAGEIVLDSTSIISLDMTSETAEQFIEAVYGNAGESGYRIAFVWDSGRILDPLFLTNPEDANLHSSNLDLSELFFVTITDHISPALIGEFPADLGDFITIADLIENGLADETSFLGGDFNFQTLFAKVDAWTREDLILRTDSPFVFTTVEVRNDQDINLFVGQDATNGLNSLTEILEARIETPGMASVPNSPGLFVNVPIPDPPVDEIIDQPNRIILTQPELELMRFEDGESISYVPVEVEELEILEIDGELILKDPQSDEYEEINKDETTVELSDVNKNQIEKIKQAIESDARAEAGIWYKVFVEFENEDKQNELLFYYFKTGEQADQALGPVSDFGDSSEEQEPAVEDNGSDSDSQGDEDETPASQQPDLGDQGNLITPQEQVVAVRIADASERSDRSDRGSERLGLSSGTILLATLAARQKKDARPAQVPEHTVEANVGFGRFDRLKRRVARFLKR